MINPNNQIVTPINGLTLKIELHPNESPPSTHYHPHFIQSNILESKYSKTHNETLNDEAKKDWISISDSESVAYETKFDENHDQFEKIDFKSIPNEIAKHEDKSTQANLKFEPKTTQTEINTTPNHDRPILEQLYFEGGKKEFLQSIRQNENTAKRQTQAMAVSFDENVKSKEIFHENAVSNRSKTHGSCLKNLPRREMWRYW
jgi:hypothetical protein